MSTRTAQPQAGTFMEWAVGKQGEMMRPNSGKLMKAGSKIRWDIHYSNGGEDITDDVQLGIYFYPKGQEPKFRQVLHLMGATNAGGVDIPPNTVKSTEGFFVMKENGRVESFQPHMHLRGKAMQMSAILPNGQVQILSTVRDFNFNWMSSYLYADDAAPLLPKGTIIKVEAWHDNTVGEQEQPGSERVGRLRRSHGGRDGARVGQRHLHGRRRLQGGTRGSSKRRSPRARRSNSSSSAHVRGASGCGRTCFDKKDEGAVSKSGAAPFPHSGEPVQMRANRIAVATLGGCDGLRYSEARSGSVSRRPAPIPRRARRQLLQRRFRSATRVRPCIRPSKVGGRSRTARTTSCIGYYNRNKDQTIDIPIGPNNHIDPGGPDMLQPTHFEPGRAWGVFALPVPKDFGTKKFTWTIVANGKPAMVQVLDESAVLGRLLQERREGEYAAGDQVLGERSEMTGPPTASR